MKTTVDLVHEKLEFTDNMRFRGIFPDFIHLVFKNSMITDLGIKYQNDDIFITIETENRLMTIRLNDFMNSVLGKTDKRD